MPRPLHLRLYAEPALSEAARIIGYSGIELFGFWDKVKETKLDHRVSKQELLDAVHELTRTDRREASPPRYELTAPARRACFQLLGPPPEHPWHGRLVKGPPLGSEEELRRWREQVEVQADRGRKPRRGKCR